MKNNEDEFEEVVIKRPKERQKTQQSKSKQDAQYSFDSIFKSTKYKSIHKDILYNILDENESYTLKQIDDILEKTLNRKVGEK